MAMSDGWAEDDFSEIAPSEGYNDVWAVPASETTDPKYLRNTSEHADYELPTDTCVYRRNSAGKWVVVGPVELVQLDTDVVVTTRAGKAKIEHVLGLGEPFERHGHEYRYGYIAARANTYRTGTGRKYQTQEDAAKSYRKRYGA